MKREPDLEAGQAGATRRWLWSEWLARRARLPYLLRRLIVVALVVFVVGGIPWTYFNIKYSREVERELARLRDAGEPLTIEEMIPEPVPDDQNAAVIYQEVFQVVFGHDQPPSERADAFGIVSPDEYQRLLDSLDYDGPFETDWVREVFSRPDAIRVLNTIEQASHRPCAVWAIRWEDGFGALFPHLTQYREAARLCSMRARLSAADGDIDDALHWTGVCLRMSRQAMTEPILMAQLVAIAIEAITLRATEDALKTGMPSPDAARRLQRTVADLDLSEAFRIAMIGERGMALEMFDLVERGTTSEATRVLAGGQNPPPLLIRMYCASVARPLRKLDKAAYLRHWRERMTRLDEPYRSQKAAEGAQLRRLRDETWLMVVTQMMWPAMTHASMKRDMGIARLDELRIVLDLKMHKREHGSYPATLDDMDQELPEDPFSGEAYRYERRGEGFLLYSFGRNMQDDGGTEQEGPIYDGDNSDIVWECEG